MKMKERCLKAAKLFLEKQYDHVILDENVDSFFNLVTYDATNSAYHFIRVKSVKKFKNYNYDRSEMEQQFVQWFIEHLEHTDNLKIICDEMQLQIIADNKAIIRYNNNIAE